MVQSSVFALYALCAIMVLASALIVYSFVTHDYSIKYVTMYSDGGGTVVARGTPQQVARSRGKSHTARFLRSFLRERGRAA